MAHEKGLEEGGRIETVLIGARLPSVANNEFLVSGFESQGTGFACLIDIPSVLQTNRIFVLNTAGKITDGDICLPEIGPLAIQHQRVLLCPSQNRLLRLNHAETLAVLGTIMNLKINVHGIMVFFIFFTFGYKITTIFRNIQDFAKKNFYARIK